MSAVKCKAGLVARIFRTLGRRLRSPAIYSLGVTTYNPYQELIDGMKRLAAPKQKGQHA